MNKKSLAFVVGIGLLLTAAWFLPVNEWMKSGLQWIEQHKKIAWLVFILAYIVAIVLMLPASAFSLAAGYLFGFAQGWWVVITAATIGAILAFLVGQFFLRDWVVSKVQKMKHFTNLDAAVAQKGFLIVLLTRLTPVIPFVPLNYAYSITKIKLSHYALATFLGIMPGSFLFVYAGTSAKNLQEILNGNLQIGSSTLLLVIGFIATILVTVLVTRIASKALKDAANIE